MIDMRAVMYFSELHTSLKATLQTNLTSATKEVKELLFIHM
jgi:hypothetical protein